MSKDDVIETEGRVIEALPNATFKVRLTNGHVITAYISGKLRMNYIRIIEGDSVNEPLRPDQGQNYLAEQIVTKSKSKKTRVSRKVSANVPRKEKEKEK